MTTIPIPITSVRTAPVRTGLQVADSLVRHGLLHLLDGVDEVEVVQRGAEVVVQDSVGFVPPPGTHAVGARVVLLHDGIDDAGVLAAVRAGVSALVARSASAEEITAVVQWVAGGGETLDRSSASAVMRALRADPEPSAASLSDREQEVLDLVVRGLDNRSIGQRLFIAESTVKFHLRRIRTKLGARSRTELVAIAMGSR